MIKLERVIGITLLTALICTLQVGLFEHIYDRAAAVIAALAKAMVDFV